MPFAAATVGAAAIGAGASIYAANQQSKRARTRRLPSSARPVSRFAAISRRGAPPVRTRC
jgi:hypothetical protein